MKIRTYKYALLIFSVLVAASSGYFFWTRNHPDNKSGVETFATAKARCGHDPVIGVDEGEELGKVYYAPSDSNNKLLSQYNPGSLNLSDYNNPAFFCSISEARANGYQPHKCCGAVLPEDLKNR